MKAVIISPCHGVVVEDYTQEAEEASGRCPVCDIQMSLDRICEACDADQPIGSQWDDLKKCWHCGD